MLATVRPILSCWGPPTFITRDSVKRVSALNEYGARFWVESHGAQVLISQGHHPVLTVNEPKPDRAAVWIGIAGLQTLRDSP